LATRLYGPPFVVPRSTRYPVAKGEDVAVQPIDGAEKSWMHFHEIDGAEIGNRRFSNLRGCMGQSVRKAEAAIDNGDFLSCGLRHNGNRGE